MESPPFAMSLNDAARWIGVSRSTICRLAARGEIPKIKVGRRTVVLSNHLAEFLLGQERIASQEVGS
jgi:excisionase family DNA binding protein